MKMLNKQTLLYIGALTLLSCGDSPKIIEVTEAANKESNSGQTGIFSTAAGEPENAAVPPVSANVHTAVAQEVLPTERYVYVRMKEGEEEYWIATVKQDVETGKTYFFRDGLLKTNFESKEYNRTFDRIFLVSNIVPADHGSENPAAATIPGQQEKTSNADVRMPIRVEGSIPMSELLSNPSKYAGREIQVSGLCTKINPNIMGRNWIHLTDGTAKDQDLVLTSDMLIPEGAVITMRGTVAVDLDFGAGYRYDILVEKATMVK